MRLERAFLLEQLNKHMEYNVDDSDRSSSPPPTPTDKPLRSKRSHNRKGTPPLGGSGGGAGSAAGGEGERLGLEGRMGAMGQMGHGMSSAQSTPDPGRQQGNYFGTIGAGGNGAAATSPHISAVNGAPPPSLPPLHALPSLQPQPQQQPAQTQPQRPFFDPAYDDQRPTPASNEDEGGRRRAHSGAAQQPPAPSTESAPPPQNGDTEMTDASFTAVNR